MINYLQPTYLITHHTVLDEKPDIYIPYKYIESIRINPFSDKIHVFDALYNVFIPNDESNLTTHITNTDHKTT